MKANILFPNQSCMQKFWGFERGDDRDSIVSCEAKTGDGGRGGGLPMVALIERFHFVIYFYFVEMVSHVHSQASGTRCRSTTGRPHPWPNPGSHSAVVSTLDVSKVLYSKSLRDKGNDNSVFHQVIMVFCSLGQKLTQPMLHVTLRSHTHQ